MPAVEASTADSAAASTRSVSAILKRLRFLEENMQPSEDENGASSFKRRNISKEE
jgi:hypothetical protein